MGCCRIGSRLVLGLVYIKNACIIYFENIQYLPSRMNYFQTLYFKVLAYDISICEMMKNMSSLVEGKILEFLFDFTNK